jgi:hypothetical protein
VVEFFVRLTFAMDLGVGVDDGSLESLGRSAVAEFAQQEGNLIDSQFAGEFACGVGTHAISHNEEVPAFGPLIGILGQRHTEVVLVVRAAHPEVGQGSDGQNLFPLNVAVAHSRCRFCWLMFPDIEKSNSSASKLNQLASVSPIFSSGILICNRFRKNARPANLEGKS